MRFSGNSPASIWRVSLVVGGWSLVCTFCLNSPPRTEKFDRWCGEECRQCRAAGCQSVWRPPVTLRTTPPHFFLRLYHPSTLFHTFMRLHQLPSLHTFYTSLPPMHSFYMSLPHFCPSYDSKKVCRQDKHMRLFRIVIRKNIFFTVSLTEWVVPPIDQWFVIFFFFSWHILDNLTIL